MISFIDICVAPSFALPLLSVTVGN